jgi:XTP/dITP diphosphohydrolase
LSVIVFATRNKNKVREINEILQAISDGAIPLVIDLDEIGFQGEIPETSDTIEGNAIQKAQYIYDHFGVDCFAEDTGLEIEALDGQPGILSARYAGPDCNSDDNIALVLQKLKNQENRQARFKTVIALIYRGELMTFEGLCEGTISGSGKGSGGFGYDPIFIPAGDRRTFAQMDSREKNKISHRYKALNKMLDFFRKMDKSQK